MFQGYLVRIAVRCCPLSPRRYADAAAPTVALVARGRHSYAAANDDGESRATTRYSSRPLCAGADRQGEITTERQEAVPVAACEQRAARAARARS